MKINLNRTIEIDRDALVAFMIDMGHEEDILSDGDSGIRDFVRDWIWFSGSGGLEEHITKYEEMTA